MTLRFIRRKVAQPLFMIPMCALILYFTVDVKLQAANTVNNYTGEELFKGIFFAEGRVAAAIPELQGCNVRDFVTDAKKVEAIVSRQNAIFNAMGTTGYFRTLQSAVATHNQLQIQQTLAFGAQLVKAKTEELGFGISPELEQAILKDINPGDYSHATVEQLKAAAQHQAEVITADNYMGIYACIAIVIVLVLAIALAFVLVIPFAANPDSDSLYQERLVGSVAKL